MTNEKLKRYALYAPSLDTILFTDTNVDVMFCLSAIISSKIAAVVVRIDTAKNLIDDFDNYVCFYYKFKSLQSDLNFFEASVFARNTPYEFTGEFEPHWDIEIDARVKELQDFLMLARKIRWELDTINRSKFFDYINDMCPEVRLVTGKDIYSMRRKCYEILYSEKNTLSAKNKLEEVLGVKL